MKTLAILGLIVGIFLLGGIFMTSAGVFNSSQDTEIQTASSDAYGCTEEGCPSGECTATNNCGLSTCRATTGGSCGCRG